MGLRDATNRSLGGRINKALGGVESTLPWVRETKKFTEIEAHAGMAEWMARDLAIEEALQEEKKDTLEHNNQSYAEWCAQTDKGKKITSHFLDLICYYQ